MRNGFGDAVTDAALGRYASTYHLPYIYVQPTTPTSTSTLPTWLLPVGAGAGTFLLGLGIAYIAAR